MNATAVLALIAALVQNAPALSQDMQKLAQSLTGMLHSNPAATAAEIQSAIAASLSDAAATDKQLEDDGS